MASGYLIEKADVVDAVSDFIATLAMFDREDEGAGYHKRSQFLKALETLYRTDDYSEGWKLLPHETYEDGIAEERYHRIYRFLLKIGVIDNDD